MPKVSVCIAHYQGVELIDACIASLRAQAGGIDVEIVVHDDASPDGSAAHIRAQHPDVKLIASAENVGFCVANNRMAAAARGDWLLLLNNDATLLPDALQTLLAEAERIGRPAILTLPQYDAETEDLLDIGSRLDPFLNPVPNRDPARAEVGTVHGACLWIPKALWDDLGGFPEWFGSVGEDLYLCCRARLAGHPVRALGVSGYRHRVGQSFGGGKVVGGRLASTYRRRALSERNKTFVMAMSYPAPFLFVVLPLHLLLLLTEGVLLSIANAQLAYLASIYWPVFAALWRERRALCHGRHKIMRACRVRGVDFFSAFDPFPYKLRMLLRHGLPKVT
ncbi:MAG: glycosyltransferase [Rhodocyclaceae bacterium]